MRRLKTCTLLAMASLFLLTNICYGTDHFQKLTLANGIVIEIPKHWLILDKISDSEIQTAAQAATEKADFSRNGTKINLLRANSAPKFADETIAINYYSDDNIDATAIAELSDPEILEVVKMWYAAEEKILSQLSPSVKLSSLSFARKNLGNHPVISFSYIRPTIGLDPDKSGFKVIFSRCFLKTGFISVVQSFRVGKEMLYQMVMEKILNSIAIPDEL